MTQQALALIATLVIFVRAELVINLMGTACRLPVRAAFWLVGVGSAGLVLSITQGYRPNWATALVLAGFALVMVVERRVRGLLRRPPLASPDRRRPR